MAAVLPLRPNTNSSGTSASNNSQIPRHPSPSYTRSTRSGSQSTHDEPIALEAGNHKFESSKHYATQRNGSASNQRLSSPQRKQQKPYQRNAKHVRSQYPANDTEKHVEYILVASFDIDRGSVMEHQYPGPVGGDEHMLAELMLPDQAHVRSQDWTIFFLHKDAEMEEEEQESKRMPRRRRRKADKDGKVQIDPNADNGDDLEEPGLESDGGDSEDDDDDLEDQDANLDGPPLVYVLNLVNTKQDNTVKRGAVVKAMAICTRHSFLHIYKPLLLLALEQYFARPGLETLASLYDAVNGMDLSLMPRLNHLERSLLQASDAKDLFIEKFEAMVEQRFHANKGQDATMSPLERTNTGQQVRSRYGLPRDTHEFESVVKYANVPVPVKIPTAASPETVGDFSLIKLITTFSTPHTTSPVPFTPTHPHLTTSGSLTHPIIVLLNALLTQKRVIFLGYNLPSSEVAEAVLAACSLASGGLLRGFNRHAFPYTDLTKIDDLLKVPGFIAGVTNPAFAHKTEWWDVLCDLSTGKMRISNCMEQAPITEGVAFFQQATSPLSATAGGPGGMNAMVAGGGTLSGGNAIPTSGLSGDATGDGAFMQSVLTAIHERHGENAIRSKFRKWIVKFTRLAASFEETVYGASALHIHNPDSPMTTFTPAGSPSVGSPGIGKFGHEELPPEVFEHGYVWSTPANKAHELAANATRIEGWRTTRSYYNFVQDLAATYVFRPVKNLDLHHLHDKLAKLRLGHDQSANIYLAICAAVQNEREICYLLTVIANGVWENKPTAAGIGQSHGLLHLGMGLFHQRLEVREEIAELLGRIRDHEAGRHFWNTLARFVKIAWERVMGARVERWEKLGGFDDS